jgi:hypothetical protein
MIDPLIPSIVLFLTVLWAFFFLFLFTSFCDTWILRLLCDTICDGYG